MVISSAVVIDAYQIHIYRQVILDITTDNAAMFQQSFHLIQLLATVTKLEW